MKIEIQTVGSTIQVKSPYESSFPAKAKRLGGKWKAPYWVFDARDLDRVRDLCRATWGTDGTEAEGPLEAVRLRCLDTDYEYESSVFVGNVPVARAFGRDSGAKLEPNVVVLEGRGFDSGGSRKNWATVVHSGTVIEIRDLPAGAAAKIRKEYEPGASRIWAVVDAETADREACLAELRAERDRLVARIAEIDAELKQEGGSK